MVRHEPTITFCESRMASLGVPAISSQRSSVTAVEDDKSSLRLPTLEREITMDELHFEKYGGDDINEPPGKAPSGEPHPQPPPEPESDPNVVTWDGPNDPANPQNWSRKYKWIITVICSIVTINV
jgi:MFS transporter, DHA1 family, multidrug resistance protein